MMENEFALDLSPAWKNREIYSLNSQTLWIFESLKSSGIVESVISLIFNSGMERFFPFACWFMAFLRRVSENLSFLEFVEKAKAEEKAKAKKAEKTEKAKE